MTCYLVLANLALEEVLREIDLDLFEFPYENVPGFGVDVFVDVVYAGIDCSLSGLSFYFSLVFL